MEKCSVLIGLRQVVVLPVLVSSLVAGVPLAGFGTTVVAAECDVDSGPGRSPVVVLTRQRHHRPLGIVSLALIATLGLAAAAQSGGAQRAPEIAVKAAFIYNFAKFTEWPELPAGAPIVACIVGDDRIAAAFVEIVRGQTVDNHRLVLGPSQDSSRWRACHVLFIADAETRRSVDRLAEITRLPVLTVSDGKGFARAGGIIELYSNAGRLQFVINAEAAERSGLRLSSKLLSLATVIRQARSPSR